MFLIATIWTAAVALLSHASAKESISSVPPLRAGSWPSRFCRHCLDTQDRKPATQYTDWRTDV